MIDTQINKKLDYEMYVNFCHFKTAGVDFGTIIRKEHPLITALNYREYIDDFYLDNDVVLRGACDELMTAVTEKQAAFFAALYGLFGIDFQSNPYKGFISIFNCNPRFVESGTFQIFYKKSLADKLEVVSHEVTHLAFFEYCKINLKNGIGDKTAKLNTDSGPLWKLSEIFNVLAMNEPEFQQILGREEKLFYPDLKEKYKMVQKIWEGKERKRKRGDAGSDKMDTLNDFIIESLARLSAR